MRTFLVAVRRVLAAGGLAWSIAVLFLWIFQERLLFPASTAPLTVPPARGGVVFALKTISAADATLHFLAAAPADGRPVILFFHGNGGRADIEAPGLAGFARLGFGIVAVAYRGYAGNPGRPSAAALSADAALFADWAAKTYPGSRLVIWGESLGTGVAAHLAATRPGAVAGVIFDAPYTSLGDVASWHFPWAPARALIRHRFDTLALMPALTMPVLVLHGEGDRIVPVAMGRAILAAAPCPAGGVFPSATGHMAFWQDNSGAARRAVASFLAAIDAGTAGCAVASGTR